MEVTKQILQSTVLFDYTVYLFISYADIVKIALCSKYSYLNPLPDYIYFKLYHKIKNFEIIPLP